MSSIREKQNYDNEPTFAARYIEDATDDQGNYAAERGLVGAQAIDPNSSGESAGFHGWRRKLARMSTDEITHLVCAMEDAFAVDLRIVGKELASVQSERDALKSQVAHIAGMDDFTKASIRDIIIERNFYRTERDMLEASLKQWQDEAAQKQAEVIAVADGAAQLRSVFLTLDGELYWQPEQCVWVLKEATGDALRRLAIQLRGIDQGEPFRDAA